MLDEVPPEMRRSRREHLEDRVVKVVRDAALHLDGSSDDLEDLVHRALVAILILRYSSLFEEEQVVLASVDSSHYERVLPLRAPHAQLQPELVVSQLLPRNLDSGLLSPAESLLQVVGDLYFESALVEVAGALLTGQQLQELLLKLGPKSLVALHTPPVLNDHDLIGGSLVVVVADLNVALHGFDHSVLSELRLQSSEGFHCKLIVISTRPVARSCAFPRSACNSYQVSSDIPLR